MCARLDWLTGVADQLVDAFDWMADVAGQLVGWMVGLFDAGQWQ